MNLSEKNSRTSFFRPSLEGPFTYFADAKHGNTSHVMRGMEWSNIESPIKLTEILDLSLKLNDAPLFRARGMMDWAQRITESLCSTIEHRGSSASDSFTRYRGLEKRALLYEALKNALGEFSSHFPAAELTSFEEVTLALKRRGLNRSAERIEELLAAGDLEPNDKPLSLESARGFIKLMDIFQDLGEPMLGRFSEGTLTVAWRLADDKHLLIEPLNGDDASFALIGPSFTRGTDRFRLNGRGKIADVIDALRKNKVDKWRDS